MKKAKSPPLTRKVSPLLTPKSIKKPVKSVKILPEARSKCPINLALEMIGDAWSMLIIRDIMLRNHTGYQAFLSSGEKIATNILADRLVKLEAYELITKSADPKDARKFIYALTEKGANLAPILIEMVLFSAQFSENIDIAKDQLQAMQRNKIQFAKDIIKTYKPRVRTPSKPKSRVQNLDETLSLF